MKQPKQNKPSSPVIKAGIAAASLFLIAIIGVLILVLSVGKIHGRIECADWQGHRLITSGVDVYALPQADVQKWLAEKNQKSDALLQGLRDEYADFCRQAQIQPAKDTAGMSVGFVRDVVMNVASAGVWSIVKPSYSHIDQEASMYRAQDRYWKMQVWPVAGYYYKDLPLTKAIAHDVTDADGYFTLKLPRRQSVVLIATTDYRIEHQPPRGGVHFDFTPPDRKCFWFVSASLGNDGFKHIDLTDKNAADSGSADSAVKASCYDWWQK